jgi:shikimate kinase
MGARAVFLIGFMGSGKTTVGQLLARRLGWEFVDLDARIRAREGKSIPTIFEERGEAGFRAAEASALVDLTESLERGSVVALGGGAFAQETNRQLLASSSWPSIFLHTPVEELWRRCSDDPEIRPLRKNREQFGRLYVERLPSYQQATITVETSGKDPAVICAAIEEALERNEGGAE